MRVNDCVSPVECRAMARELVEEIKAKKTEEAKRAADAEKARRDSEALKKIEAGK